MPCKDCGGGKRPAPYPGPRCYSHWREEKMRRKEAAHERMVQKTYGLAEGEYARLYAIQGGKCAMCRRATGATRRLSVDHDHKTGAVRGLLCRPCNSGLGHARDDLDYFRRALLYLLDPPARKLRDDDGPAPTGTTVSCTCTNGYECSHFCWFCNAARES